MVLGTARGAPGPGTAAGASLCQDAVTPQIRSKHHAAQGHQLHQHCQHLHCGVLVAGWGLCSELSILYPSETLRWVLWCAKPNPSRLLIPGLEHHPPLVQL